MKENTGDEFRINDGLFHYLVRTFSRTNRKDYENYVLNAVWQGIVFRIPEKKIRFLQPVSQQYARRADGKYGLIDLYFPQLGIAVECDEAYHGNDSQHMKDVERENDMNNQLKLLSAVDVKDIRFLRVDASKSFEEVTRSIGGVVDEIVKSVEKADLSYEYFRNPVELVKEKGVIKVDDGLIFPTAWAVSECFNLGYKERMQELYMWTQNNQDIWCPLLTVENPDGKLSNVGRSGYKNHIKENWEEIWEEAPEKEGDKWNRGDSSWHDRITFAKACDSLGRNGYRFIGIYRYDRADEQGRSRIYKRISDKIELKDYPDLYKKYKEQLEKRVKDGVIYDGSLDEENRYIRFKTPCINALFPEIADHNSGWGFSPYALYEVDFNNKIERYKSISVKLCLSTHNGLVDHDNTGKIRKLVTDPSFGGHKKFSEGWINLSGKKFIIQVENGKFGDDVIEKGFDEIFNRIPDFERSLTAFFKE